MKSSYFEEMVVNKLGDYRKLPNFPFKEKLAYAIFPGAESTFVDECLYKVLFELNEKYDNKKILANPHVVTSDDENLFIQSTKYDWKSFQEMQDNHLSCEGIYISGSAFNWLGIYHYDDYLIVGGSENFIKDLCNSLYCDSDWKTRFSQAFDNGDISMYQSDYDALIEKLF